MSDSGLASPYPQDQAAMVQYLMSINPDLAGSIAPMLSPMTQGMLAGFAPDAGKLGTTGATNYVQDVASMGFDDALAAYGGPGAYAQGAFDPVTTTNVVETPGRRRLLQAMQQGTSIDSIIARVLFEGGTASDAFAEINRKVQDAVTAGDNATDDQKLLLAQIPPSDNPNAIPGELSSYDISGVMDLAEEMQTLAMKDPPEGTFAPTYAPDGTMISPGGERRWITDEQGNEVLVETTSKPSEVAQQYIDQGLSLPTEQYTAEGLLGQDWQDQAAALSGSRDVQNAASRAMRLNRQDPMLAARRSEINELPYSGPSAASTVMRGETPQQGNIPNVTFEDLGIPAPEQDVSDIMQQVNDEQLRFGYPGMYEDQSDLIAQAAANGNDVTDIINPWNSQIGGATSMPPAQPGAPIQPYIPSIITGAGGGQPAPTGQQLIDQAAANGNDVSDLNVNGYGGGFGGGTGGQYGFQGAGAALMFNPSLFLGLLPAGGQPPQPPGTGGSGAITNEPANQGYGVNGTPPQFNPQTDAMLAQILSGGTGRTTAQQQMGPPDQPQYNPLSGGSANAGSLPPEPAGVPTIGQYLSQYVLNGGTANRYTGPPQGLSPDILPGNEQRTTTLPAQGHAPYNDMLSQEDIASIIASQYNPLQGGSANAGSLPQPAGVPTIGQYLSQYVLNGGTANRYTGPPQGLSPDILPGNEQRTTTLPAQGHAPYNDMMTPEELALFLGGTDAGTPTYTGPLRPTGNTLLQIMGQQPTRSTRTEPQPSETARQTPRGAPPQPDYNALLNGSANAGSRRRGGSSTSSSGPSPRTSREWDPRSMTNWSRLYQTVQEGGQRYDPSSSANAGSRGSSGSGSGGTSSGSSSGSTGGASPNGLPAVPDELRAYNAGVGRRANEATQRARRNLGFRQQDVDAWKAAVEQGNRERSYYGAEYGRAAGLAYLMQRAGIRPLDRQLAARGQVMSAAGLRQS